MEFQIRKAQQEDIPAMAEVIREVWEQMEEKSWFVADDEAWIRQVLESGRGMAYLAETAGEAAGVFLAVFLGGQPEHLGNDLGMSEEEKQKSAHMETVAIRLAYRGYHLQYLLMQKVEQELATMGFRYLLCTVHPENRYSLKNVLDQGYEIAATKEKYGGYPRHILKKTIGL